MATTNSLRRRRHGRMPLGKVTVQLRLRPKTREELWRLAEAEQVTISDFAEAVLIQYFESRGYAKQNG
jgi:hypothetical protein